MKIAHRMDHDKIDWNSFRFMVFDIPTSKGNYQERYQQLRMPEFLQMHTFMANIGFKIEQELNGKNHRFIQIATYTLCKDTAHLEKIFQDIMDQGGEGIILRNPSTPFQSGRSSGFLKHKVCSYAMDYMITCLLTSPLFKKYRDAEAKIIGNASAVTWECEL